jgi:hypothetical protein
MAIRAGLSFRGNSTLLLIILNCVVPKHAVVPKIKEVVACYELWVRTFRVREEEEGGALRVLPIGRKR